MRTDLRAAPPALPTQFTTPIRTPPTFYTQRSSTIFSRIKQKFEISKRMSVELSTESSNNIWRANTEPSGGATSVSKKTKTTHDQVRHIISFVALGRVIGFSAQASLTTILHAKVAGAKVTDPDHQWQGDSSFPTLISTLNTTANPLILRTMDWNAHKAFRLLSTGAPAPKT